MDDQTRETCTDVGITVVDTLFSTRPGAQIKPQLRREGLLVQLNPLCVAADEETYRDAHKPLDVFKERGSTTF